MLANDSNNDDIGGYAVKKIFEGLKVLDCGSFIAAPAAATILSDFGADVIKIEPPGSGDPYRQVSKFPGNPESEYNYGWMLDNRNKRGLALDLAKPGGQAVLGQLASQADVFITNFPQGVRQRLGISYEALAPLNDRLIYASFSGYGERGEEANKPGFDMTAWWARSGMMDQVRPAAGAGPAKPTVGMGDHPSGMTLFASIVTALYQRERTGKGAQVGSSLLANGLWSNGFLAQAALCGARFFDRPPREQAPNAMTSHYRCRDGRWLLLTIANEERYWPVLVQCLGRENLINDPRFSTRTERHARSAELIAILDEVFATRDRSDWRTILGASGLVFEVVATLEDIPNDQQLLANEILVPFEEDTMLTIDSPFFVDGAEKVQPRHAPSVGEHSDKILREAGYDEAAIRDLRECGAIG
jgi:crotonobetainyl-CoA:carnitine CoA-transferase CaiB-like acyl-CoA transferase